MKNLLSLFIFVIQLNSYAQLTNTEVYDFEVGDVFYYIAQNNAPGGLYTLDTIVSKIWSQNLDTIWYGIKRKSFVPDVSGQTNGAYSYTTPTLLITDLNSAASHFTDGICGPDTTGFTKLTLDSSALCGNQMDFLTTYFDPNVPLPCLEPLQWTSKLYAGLGGPYYSITDNSAFGTSAFYFIKYLHYFNTQMHGSCGPFPSFAEVLELEKIDFMIYPNPVQTTLSIKTNIHTYNYRILSTTGQIILNHMYPAKGEIDVSHLERGIFIIELSSPTGFARKLFVKL